MVKKNNPQIEFNLSEKAECFEEDGEYIGRGYMEEDVKEFIRLLKKNLLKYDWSCEGVINSLAGSKLI